MADSPVIDPAPDPDDDAPGINLKLLLLGVVIGMAALILPQVLSSSPPHLSLNRPLHNASVPNYGDLEFPDAEDHKLYARRGTVPSETKERGPVQPPPENDIDTLEPLYLLQDPRMWPTLLDTIDKRARLVLLVKGVDHDSPITLSTLKEVDSSHASSATVFSALTSAGIKVRVDKQALAPFARALLESKIRFPDLNVLLLQLPPLAHDDAAYLGSALHAIRDSRDSVIIGVSSHPFPVVPPLVQAIENNAGAARELAFGALFPDHESLTDVRTASLVLGAAHTSQGYVRPGIWAFGSAIDSSLVEL